MFMPSARWPITILRGTPGSCSPRMRVILREFKLVFGDNVCVFVKDDAPH